MRHVAGESQYCHSSRDLSQRVRVKLSALAVTECLQHVKKTAFDECCNVGFVKHGLSRKNISYTRNLIGKRSCVIDLCY